MYDLLSHQLTKDTDAALKIPLVVRPGKLQKPATITMPYEVSHAKQELPPNQIKDTLNHIKELSEQCNDLKSNLQNTASDLTAQEQRYLQWRKDITRMAPGLLDEGILKPKSASRN